MSLSYKLDAVPKHVWCNPDGTMNPRTWAIIQSMMFLGLQGQITQKNLSVACTQFAALQLVMGPLLRSDTGRWYYITESDIKAHVGLWTNAFSPSMNTPAAFKKFLLEHLLDEDHMRKALAQAVESDTAACAEGLLDGRKEGREETLQAAQEMMRAAQAHNDARDPLVCDPYDEGYVDGMRRVLEHLYPAMVTEHDEAVAQAAALEEE
jgi:hypothetical protein